MVAGEYSATMTIQSDQVETITIPIELSLTTIDSTPLFSFGHFKFKFWYN